MRIEKIFIRDLKRSFETKLDTNDNIIYVVDNELLSNGCYKNGFLNNMLIWCQEDKSVKTAEKSSFKYGVAGNIGNSKKEIA